MSAPNSGFDFQAMGHELRTNRKTQAALVGMVLVLGFMAYTLFGSDAPKGRRPVDTKTGVSLDARQLQGLRKLPDLAALDKAGQLPPLAKVQRDLFMFEAPAPPPPPVKVVVPPPPRRPQPSSSRPSSWPRPKPPTLPPGPRTCATWATSRGIHPAPSAPS